MRVPHSCSASYADQSNHCWVAVTRHAWTESGFCDPLWSFAFGDDTVAKTETKGLADIFLSYSRKDSSRADAVVQALKALGWSVWFDRYTPTAGKWVNIIESELERARCVVILWSDDAMESDWVRREGIAGLDRAVLVPVRIRESYIPDVFGSIQFADLTSWDGDRAAPAFTELVQSIRNQMLPHCRISFESLFQPRLDDLKDLSEAYLHVTERLGCVPAPGRFHPPSTPDGQRRMHRAVASLQVSIEWDSTLSNYFLITHKRQPALGVNMA